jgi:hypothetical protein
MFIKTMRRNSKVIGASATTSILAVAFWLLPFYYPVVLIDYIRWHPGLQNALIINLVDEPTLGNCRRQELLKLLVVTSETSSRRQGLTDILREWSNSRSEEEFELWVEAASLAEFAPTEVAERIAELCVTSCLRFDAKYYWPLIEYASSMSLASMAEPSPLRKMVKVASAEVKKGGPCGDAVLHAYIDFLAAREQYGPVSGEDVFDWHMYNAMIDKVGYVTSGWGSYAFLHLHRANPDLAMKALIKHPRNDAGDLIGALSLVCLLAEVGQWESRHIYILNILENEARDKFRGVSEVRHQLMWTNQSVISDDKGKQEADVDSQKDKAKKLNVNVRKR